MVEWYLCRANCSGKTAGTQKRAGVMQHHFPREVAKGEAREGRRLAEVRASSGASVTLRGQRPAKCFTFLSNNFRLTGGHYLYNFFVFDDDVPFFSFYTWPSFYHHILFCFFIIFIGTSLNKDTSICVYGTANTEN